MREDVTICTMFCVQRTTERTLSDETASTIDTGGVELHELKILQGETSTGDHGITITRASVRTRAREVRATVATSREHSLMRAEAVKGTVLHVERDDTDALAILHDQVESEVLNEEVGVVTEGLAVEGVEEGVAGTVGGSGATVRLATLSELERLPTECTLVNFALLGS